MVMEQTPHYPTSAELAAFRRTIHNGRGCGPATDRMDGLDVPADGGAWPHERRDGIGYPTQLIHVRADQSNMRREAAAMRSRAAS